MKHVLNYGKYNVKSKTGLEPSGTSLEPIFRILSVKNLATFYSDFLAALIISFFVPIYWSGSLNGSMTRVFQKFFQGPP